MKESLKSKVSHFKNIHVRNMYWILFSPSPIAENTISNLPIFPDSWLREIEEEQQLFFKNLDSNPHNLEKVIKDSTTHRLGIYAEVLLAYFFEHVDGIELKYYNFQVIEEKQTLGEVDFIILWKNRLIHIELATKFYLAQELTSELTHWVGPTGKDNLGIKINKVRDSQLQLVKNPVFIKQTGLQPTSYLMLKGQFYTRDNYSPNWKNNRAKYNSYYYYSEIIEGLLKQPNNFTLLEKPHWFSSIILSGEAHEINLLEKNKIANYLQKNKSLHLFDRAKSESLFVVKDNWKDNTKKLL